MRLVYDVPKPSHLDAVFEFMQFLGIEEDAEESSNQKNSNQSRNGGDNKGLFSLSAIMTHGFAIYPATEAKAGKNSNSNIREHGRIVLKR